MRKSVIRRCLDGILNIDYPKEKMQIIVVDGKSDDNTCKICSEFSEKYPENIKVISEKTAKGKPAALNLALPYVTGEIVGVFDADSLPEKDVLSKVASYFDDKKVMALQGRTTSINEKNNALTRVIAVEEKAWFQALLSGREKLQLFVPLTGSCQFVRRNVVDELGGWDENSLTEDVEFALRLVEKKHLIKYAPDVCSGQETPNSLGHLVKQRVRWYRGYMETAIKYGRLLDTLNKRTVDAEISMAGPFMMVVSLLSYINWFFVALFLSQSNSNHKLYWTSYSLNCRFAIYDRHCLNCIRDILIDCVIILWIPSIYVYWIIQMFIAGFGISKTYI